MTITIWTINANIKVKHQQFELCFRQPTDPISLVRIGIIFTSNDLSFSQDSSRNKQRNEMNLKVVFVYNFEHWIFFRDENYNNIFRNIMQLNYKLADRIIPLIFHFSNTHMWNFYFLFHMLNTFFVDWGFTSLGLKHLLVFFSPR